MKSSQAGLSGAKRSQTGQNGAKWCQTGSNGAKGGQRGPKRAKKGKTWQPGPNKANWGYKIGRAMLLPKFLSGSTKKSVSFLALVKGNLFLYHRKAYLNGFILSRGFKFFGAPFMVKIDFKSIFSLFLNLRPF